MREPTGSLRVRNRVRVVDALRRRGPASRADIAATAGLSRATVSSLVAELLDSGLLVERKDGEGASRTGRPPVLLALDPAAGGALGVDFGHAHLRVALADLNADVRAERHVGLDVDHDADEALDAAAELVDELLAEADIDRDALLGCGLGLPGPIDADTGTVGSTVILPGWRGRHAGDELASRLGVQVTVDNDANLGALAEMTYGAARGARDLVYVKAASGVGAGIVLGGRLHRGIRRHGRRARPRPRRGRRPRLPLREPRLPGDRGGRARRCSRCCASPTATTSRSAGCSSSPRAATSARGASCRTPGWRSAAPWPSPSTCSTPSSSSSAATSPWPASRCSRASASRSSRYALPAAAEAARVTGGVLGDRAEVLGALALVIADTENLRSEALGALSDHHNHHPAAPVPGGGTPS